MTRLPNWVQFARRPSMLVTWYRVDTSIAEDLTGATITGLIKSIAPAAVSTAITGTLTITDAAAGIFRWDFSANDVATHGDFSVQFTAAFGSGQTPAKTFKATWQIEKALVLSA